MVNGRPNVIYSLHTIGGVDMEIQIDDMVLARIVDFADEQLEMFDDDDDLVALRQAVREAQLLLGLTTEEILR